MTVIDQKAETTIKNQLICMKEKRKGVVFEDAACT